jgi:fibronectin type 3 domain-containing protein
MPGPVKIEVPAAEWPNGETMGGVRVAGPSGRWSAWSNLVVLQVVPPLRVPQDLTVHSHPKGARVSWRKEERPGIIYQIFRKAPKETTFSLIGKQEGTEFVDSTAVLGSEYSYVVEAVVGSAKSERSQPVSVTPQDIFGPAKPSGITAIAGLNTVELGWERNDEADLQGYRVYRSAAGAPFERIAESLAAPAFSDKNITSGKTYRYTVTAVDTVGNESDQSAPVEIVAP